MLGMRYFSLALLLGSAVASPGDDLYTFQECNVQCREIVCNKSPYHLLQQEHPELEHKRNYDWKPYNPNWTFDAPSLYLRTLLWSCRQNCDYQCQQIVTAERKLDNLPVVQFHGKWPFKRIFGIQEFVSAFFSLGNFYVNYLGFHRLKTSATSFQFFNVFLVSIISMLAWISSTIFHIRDFLFTEKLDYYFAGATVLTGFHAIAARLFNLHRKPILCWIWFSLCVLAFTAHVYRLETDWLYTYNMRANITIGILQNCLLSKLCFNIYYKYYNQSQTDLSYINYTGKMILPSFFKSSKLYSLYPLLLTVIVTLGVSLEVFDFAPFFDLVDAHALWHAVTIIPLYYGWYDWMVWDIKENVEKELAEIERKKNE